MPNDSKYGQLYPERAVALLRQLAQDAAMGERVIPDDFQRALETLRDEGFPPDEPLLLLRGQDVLAADAVRFYAELVMETRNEDLDADDIMAIAERMRQWTPRKLPD